LGEDVEKPHAQLTAALHKERAEVRVAVFVADGELAIKYYGFGG